jgi:hypothetical protein
LTIINEDSLNRTCAFLDTTILLSVEYSEKEMTVLVNEIETIKSATRVIFSNEYRLHIEKGNLFDWGNIGIQVIEVLESLTKNNAIKI